MKTAWMGSLLVHATLAVGLLWLAIDHPAVNEIGPISAVTVALVNAPAEAPAEAIEAGAPASPVATAASARVNHDRTAARRLKVAPVQPLPTEATAGAALSEPTGDAPVSTGMPSSSAPAVTATTESVGAGLTGTTSAGPAAAAPAGGDNAAPADPWPAYFAAVRTAVERAKHYPFSARLAGLEDRVAVNFLIAADGAAEQIHVTGPSRFPVLNDAAVETIRRAARFPAPPLRDSQSGVRVTVPLEFSLHNHQEAQQEAQPE